MATVGIEKGARRPAGGLVRALAGAVLAASLAWLGVASHAAPAAAQDGSRPPGDLLSGLGLAWGMSVDDVLDLGYYDLAEMDPEPGHGIPYMADRYPRVLDDMSRLFLFFGYDDRLWRIAILGGGVRDRSGLGTALFERYDELNAMLAQIYGEGVQYHFRPASLADDPGFTLGSLQVGQSWHFTEYRHGDDAIQLGLKARHFAAGYYALYMKSAAMEEKVLADEEARAAAGADEARPTSEDP